MWIHKVCRFKVYRTAIIQNRTVLLRENTQRHTLLRSYATVRMVSASGVCAFCEFLYNLQETPQGFCVNLRRLREKFLPDNQYYPSILTLQTLEIKGESAYRMHLCALKQAQVVATRAEFALLYAVNNLYDAVVHRRGTPHLATCG